MGWKDALLGANERQSGPVFAAYGHLQEVAFNARNQTADGYRLLTLHGSHPWLTDDQTQAAFYSAWMLNAFVKAAQASVDEVTVKGTISKEAVALGQLLYDQASAWAGYWQVVPMAQRAQVRAQQPRPFQFVPPQLASAEAVRMAVVAAEAFHSSAVESVIDLGAQENLPPEWRPHLSVLQSRTQQAGDALANLTPFTTSLRQGGNVPPHLAPAVSQIIDTILALGRALNCPTTFNDSLAAKTPLNIFDLENQPAATPGKRATRYPSPDHAGLAATARSLGFDVWRLVAAEQRQQRSSERDDVRALDRLLTRADPGTDGPAITRILDEIDAATTPSTGTVIRSPKEALLGTPWSPVFVATATTILGGERFSQGEKFAYTVKIAGGRFVHTFDRLGFDPARTPPKPPRRRPPAPAEPTVEAAGSPQPAPPRTTPPQPAPDPLWRYSAPVARRLWRKDEARVRELTDLINTAQKSPLWEQLQRYQAEIEAAARDGRIEHRQQEYQERACPWAPVYVAREPVTLVGREWRRGDAFFLLLSAADGRLTVAGQSDGRRQL